MGRSITLLGLSIMTLAILLSLLPGLQGIGPGWSVVMLGGGGLVALAPKGWLHPAFAAVFAVVAAAHAFQLFEPSLVPVLWAVAAALLCYGQYRRALSAAESAFSPWLAWHGYRRYILLGTALDLAALWLKWSKSQGRFVGGYDWYTAVYNPLQRYVSGHDVPGRHLGMALYIVMALVALVVWSAYQGNGRMPRGFRPAAAGLSLGVTLWWLTHLRLYAGVWLFGLGLAAIDWAVIMILRGHNEGPYDLDHLLRRW